MYSFDERNIDMNYYHEAGENERVANARESFSGRLLTDRQFEEALALTHILEREIQRSGAFKDKLGDYAYAFARSERFDAVKAESVLRDLFKERTGQTMNQMREGYVEVQEKLTEDQRRVGYDFAAAVGDLMENGAKMSFGRAVAHQSQQMAAELGITDAAARSIMAEEFEAVEQQSLWDWGKQLDQDIYRPQIEAEKEERAQAKTRSPEASGETGSERRARSSAPRTRTRGPEMRR
jgi:hypothetical protein